MSIQAGFGRCEVPMTTDMLSDSKEHYTCIHDRPSVKVMLLKAEATAFALVNVGLVMGERTAFLDEAQTLLTIPRENIVIHFQHILSTPHYEIAENPRLHDAYLTALHTAVQQAQQTLCPAKIGVGIAQTNVTVNRVVETAEGWWQGVNPDGPTDGSVYILRVDRADGALMGLVYTLNAAPGCLEFSTLPTGRAVSADIVGTSEHFLETQLGADAVAMYCTGATGDQWTALRARLDYRTAENRQVIHDLGEVGFTLTEILGTRLGEQVLHTAIRTETHSLDGIGVKSVCFSYPHQQVLDASPAKPAKACRYELDGEDPAEVTLLTFGDSAMVFCGVELNVGSLATLRAGSPYARTWLVEFAGPGGGYLPEEDFYDRVAFQSLKCHYVKGSAERLVRDVTALLEAEHG